MNVNAPSPMRVRLGTAADWEAVDALQQLLFEGDPNLLLPADLKALGGSGRIVLLVAELNGAVSGFAVLRDRGTRPWTGIDFVGVHPKVSGLGAGTALVRACVAHARRPLVRLFVRPSNAPARKLYERQGFRHTSTRKGNYADGEDALVLMKWAGLPFMRRASSASGENR
jgi:ribosomal-protein-alanine N-acetyltransferase